MRKSRCSHHAGLCPILLAFHGFLFADEASAQAVTPDISTKTTASTSAAGKTIVRIAPADASGTSLNRYTTFNVQPAGVDLDNQSVGAATIVNEVTGVTPSTLRGPLSVLGPRAHVIVANPNGISANGVEFRNVSGVALATGGVTVGSDGKLTASVTRGRLHVGPDGLSGVMTELDLLAKEIRVNGPILNRHPDEAAKVALIGGASKTNFDTALTPGTVATWGRTTGQGGVAKGAVEVDISSASLISSGAVRVRVTDEGAGVRMAGSAIATGGDIRLSADGTLALRDVDLSAKGAINAQADRIEIASPTRQSSLKTSTSGIYLDGKAGVVVKGAKVSGVERDFSSFASVGGITIVSADGSVEILADGSIPALLQTSRESLALLAGGDIAVSEATLKSGHDVQLTAGGKVSVTHASLKSSRDVRLLSGGASNIADSAISAAHDIRAEASALAVSSSVAARSELIAEDGAVLLKASSGSIVNSGSLIEGKRASLSDLEADAAVKLVAAGDVIATSLSIDRLGVFFGRAGDLVIRAEGDVRSTTARFFSNENIVVTAGDTISIATALTGDGNTVESSTDGDRSWQSLWLVNETRHSVDVDYGVPTIAGEQALITAIGNVTLRADHFENNGGQINGLDVSVIAKRSISVASLAKGEVHFTQTCGLLSCDADGSSNVDIVPGTIVAAGSLTLS